MVEISDEEPLFLAMICNEVVLDVHKLPFCIDPLESVAAIAMVKPPTLRSTVVAEEHETSVVALWCVAEQVKYRIIVEQEVLGITPLGPDDVGALDGVATEKDGLYMLDVCMNFGSDGLQSSDQRYRSCLPWCRT